MDITKIIIEAFREHKSNYEPVLIVLNQQGNIYDINQLGGNGENSLLKLLGLPFTKEEIIGRGDYPINFVDYLKNKEIPPITPTAKQQLVQNIEHLIKGEINSFEIHPEKGNGKKPFEAEEKEFHLHFYGISGKVSGNFSILIADQTEVTYFKRMYEHANKQLKRLADLGETIAMIVHEIRNPLVTIGGFANSLRNSVKEKLRPNVDIICEEVKRLEEVLKRALDYAKPLDICKADVDLSLLVKQNYDKCGYSQLKQPEIKMELGENVNAKCDGDKIYQVFLNLVKNAIEKESANKIAIRTYLKDKYAVFEVEDDGKEIHPDVKEKLFKPFFTTKKEGTGLGLAISHKIIDCHDGYIGVESQPKKTVFSVYLPQY